MNAEVLHPFGVLGRLDGRDNFGEMDLDCSLETSAGSMWRRCGLAIEIAWLAVPVLAFAFVHGELDGVAVGAIEGGVFAEDGLDPIIAGGNIAEIGGGVAEGVVVDEGGLIGGEGVNVDAENLLRVNF